MKYIISENKIEKMLFDVINHRYEGITFVKGYSGLIGKLPNQIETDNYAMVCELENFGGHKQMVLWVYNDDIDYLLSMIPSSVDIIKQSLKDWFYDKTNIKVDMVLY